MSTDNYREYPVEIQASQYYIHRSYVNSYYYMYKFLEEWIAKNIFRNDKSRVFLASDEYAYRRRFELTDTSKDFETLDFSSLKLPFANYWPQNSGWQSDDRVAAKSAAMTYLGIYEGDTKIKAASSKLDISTTFYFDREDDARLAYDIFYFNSFNEHYYSTKVPYGRNNTVDSTKGSYSSILALPANIMISKLEFNPSYKENDWLKKQRVFIIKATFTMRTYAVWPPEQPNYDVTMNQNGSLSDGSTYEDGINYYYIVDDVILNMSHKDRQIITCDAGYNETDGSYLGTTSFPTEGEEDVIYVDSYCEDQRDKNNKPLSFYVWDSINKKYISPEKELDIQSIRYNGTREEQTLDIKRFDCISNISYNSNLLEWEYDRNTISEIKYNQLMLSTSIYDKTKTYHRDDYCIKDNELYICNYEIQCEEWNPNKWTKINNQVSNIEIHLMGKDKIELVDSSQTSYLIKGLKQNSQYTGYIIFYSKDNLSKKFIINFITSKKPKKDEKPEAGTNSLIGLTW